jgi:beta-N-acetylhexosaminidase
VAESSADVDRLLAGMTLDQKLGQLCIGGICGGEDLLFARRNFERYHFGGLMFSPVFQRFVRDRTFFPCGVCRNVPNVETARFLHEVNALSMEIGGVPCLIGGDQEGGLSGSFLRRREMTILPKPMGLAASPQADEDAYRAAAIAAREVKAMGYDMLYGPVLDVNINPANPEIGARSFGDDPAVCARLGEQFIRAYRDEGVISTAKHFPGRGRGRVDAHFELEAFDVDRETLLGFDLVAFRRAIAAGVEAVMVCHSVFRAIDPDLPASLSPAVITGLLREELGFEGLVIPDTLTMWAILKNFDVPRACAMVLEAGADMFFMKDPPRYDAAFAAVKDSLRAGRLSEERIEASVRKVLRLKQRYGLFEKRFDEERVRGSVGTEAHVDAAMALARRSTRVLTNREGLLPVREPERQTALVLVPREMAVIQANDAERDHGMLPRALARVFGSVEHVVVDPEATALQLFEVSARARNADVVVAAAMASGWNPGLAAATERALELDVPVVALLACAPQVAGSLPPKVGAAVCTFCEGPQQFEAFAECVTGGGDGGDSR